MLQSGGPLRLGTLSLHGADPVDRAIGSPVAAPIVTATSFYTDPEAVGLSPADLGADGPFFRASSNPLTSIPAPGILTDSPLPISQLRSKNS